jgi:hypothetical protein
VQKRSEASKNIPQCQGEFEDDKRLFKDPAKAALAKVMTHLHDDDNLNFFVFLFLVFRGSCHQDDSKTLNVSQMIQDKSQQVAAQNEPLLRLSLSLTSEAQ